MPVDYVGEVLKHEALPRPSGAVAVDDLVLFQLLRQVGDLLGPIDDRPPAAELWGADVDRGWGMVAGLANRDDP